VRKPACRKLMDDLFWFEDSCSVFVLKRGDKGLAIDFGTGAWLEQLPKLGIKKLDRVLLTHHHADQCVGLQGMPRRGFAVHAPWGDEPLLTPAGVRRFWKGGAGNPPPLVLDKGIRGVKFSILPRSDMHWGPVRIRFLLTPGHGQNAYSAVVNWGGKQIVFCGDAVHDGATIHRPYSLEWYHVRGDATLEAYKGVRRLSEIGIDLLCPSHGPMIDRRPVSVLRQLARKLLRWWELQGSNCVGHRDDYWPATPFCKDAAKLLPHLYYLHTFPFNTAVLMSDAGEALVVDPELIGMEAFRRLHKKLGKPPVTAAITSHCHMDHNDAMPLLQKRYGTRACLHPWIAEVVADTMKYDLPGRNGPAVDIQADELLPEDGTWQWNEYTFRVAPFPGQTWWHAAYMTAIDGVQVLFGGDSFQPVCQSGGNGGACSYFGSRYREGFIPSAQLVLDWVPDLLVNGHGAFFKFQPVQFRKIQKWALATEQAVRDLCPSGDLDTDYHIHPLGKARLWREPEARCREIMEKGATA